MRSRVKSNEDGPGRLCNVVVVATKKAYWAVAHVAPNWRSFLMVIGSDVVAVRDLNDDGSDADTGHD